MALVNRRDARIFRGSPDEPREIEQIHDEVFGQHDQGGWSQSRYQRGIEKEKDDHLKNTGDALMRHFKQQPFQRLIVGGPARWRPTSSRSSTTTSGAARRADRGRRGALGPTRCWRPRAR